MLGGLWTCELPVRDEGQQYEHEEGARWSENKFTGCHKTGRTDGHKSWDTNWIPSMVTGCHRIWNGC